MSTAKILKVIIDTNVVFEGLTKQGGAAGLIIDAWLAGLIDFRNAKESLGVQIMTPTQFVTKLALGENE